MAKKSKVEDEADHIDPDLILSIEKLQELQDELEKVNEEASEKVLEVEQEYNEKRRPVYIRRNEILKAIPSFWMTAFLSHPALVDLLSEDDLKIFKYMDSLDVEDFKDVKSGYSITFVFKPNMYFEDTKLTKTFTFLDDGTTKITGTAIKWKDGRDALNGGSQEKKGNKRQHVEESFFSWFSEKQQSDTGYVEGLTDEVAEIIKEDLWPNPLKYFNSEPDEEDSDAGDDNVGEGEDNEGEDANEDDNE